MRLSGRIAAAIDILDGLEVRRRPVSVALKDWGQAHRFAGSGDRAAIGNLVYDAMRKRNSHAFIMGAGTGRALALSVVVNDWGEDMNALNASFETDNFAPDPLTQDEMERLADSARIAEAPPHVRADLPEWLVPAFERVFGKNWHAEATALARRPPLDMRVNTLKSTPERVMKSLARFSPAPTSIAPDGLRIAPGSADRRAPNVQADESWRKGWAEIQDEGSQIVSVLVAARPGEQVLDFCAGAGGKTLALAALMENSGQLFAHDADRNRLAPIYDRLKRAGIRNVQVRAPVEGALENLRGKMDKVLVDAPCTGSGTWRRHPDAKWKLATSQLQERQAEQAAILDEAARFVRPGGQLAYVTCSVLPEENIEQIESFVARSGLFLPIDMKARWAEIFPGVPATPLFDRNGATLSPHTTGTDGFYVSILEKKSGT